MAFPSLWLPGLFEDFWGRNTKIESEIYQTTKQNDSQILLNTVHSPAPRAAKTLPWQAEETTAEVAHSLSCQKFEQYWRDSGFTCRSACKLTTSVLEAARRILPTQRTLRLSHFVCWIEDCRVSWAGSWSIHLWKDAALLCNSTWFASQDLCERTGARSLWPFFFLLWPFFSSLRLCFFLASAANWESKQICRDATVLCWCPVCSGIWFAACACTCALPVLLHRKRAKER